MTNVWFPYVDVVDSLVSCVVLLFLNSEVRTLSFFFIWFALRFCSLEMYVWNVSFLVFSSTFLLSFRFAVTHFLNVDWPYNAFLFMHCILRTHGTPLKIHTLTYPYPERHTKLTAKWQWIQRVVRACIAVITSHYNSFDRAWKGSWHGKWVNTDVQAWKYTLSMLLVSMKLYQRCLTDMVWNSRVRCGS